MYRLPDDYVQRTTKLFKSSKPALDIRQRPYVGVLLEGLIAEGYKPFLVGVESVLPSLPRLQGAITIFDYGFNVEACAAFSSSLFKVDFENMTDDDLDAFHRYPGKKVLIVIDVLGEMEAPEKLMSAIGSGSAEHELLFIMPDRLTQKNKSTDSPPTAYFRCREWALEEIRDYVSQELSSLSFSAMLVPQHLDNRRQDTAVFSEGIENIVAGAVERTVEESFLVDSAENFTDLEATSFDFTLSKSGSTWGASASCVYSDTGLVTDKLVEHLRNGVPASLIRVGHAELRFAGFPEYVQPVWLSRSLKVCFGSADVSTDYYPLRLEMLDSFRDADFLGVPSRRERDQHWRNALPLLSQHGCELGNKICHSQNIHLDMLAGACFDKLFAEVDSVLLIGCRDLRGMLMEKYDLSVVDWIEIPGEAKFVGDSGVVHYPTTYEQIRKELSEKSQPLTLVGAGLAGNAYCMWAKASGSVAIDIGSVMDVWAGENTRSNFQKYGMHSLIKETGPVQTCSEEVPVTRS